MDKNEDVFDWLDNMRVVMEALTTGGCTIEVEHMNLSAWSGVRAAPGEEFRLPRTFTFVFKGPEVNG